MKIFSTVNISKLTFWLVLCIKNFIWTTLKVIFSIFRFFCTLIVQIFNQILSYHNKPYINGKLFIQLSDDAYISISEKWPFRLVLGSRVIFIQFSKDPKFRHAPEINKHHLTVLTMAVKNDNSAEKWLNEMCFWVHVEAGAVDIADTRAH